jgi:hypothetical protein
MSASSVTTQCDSGNGYDGRLGVRISSIFVIGIGSMLGASEKVYVPSTSANVELQVPYSRLPPPEQSECVYRR